MEEKKSEILDDQTNILQDSNSTITCDTLKEYFSEIMSFEDVSVFCDSCKEFIYYGDIKSHRKLHECLSFFQFQELKSITFKSLAKRRNKIRKQISTLLSNRKDQLMQKLDMAYTTLYNSIIEDYRQDIFSARNSNSVEQPHIYREICDKFANTTNGLIGNEFETSFDTGFALRCSPELIESVVKQGNISENVVFFALVTGVDGQYAQKFVSENIVQYLTKEMLHGNNSEHNDFRNKLLEAQTRVILELDKSLGTGLYDKVTFNRWSSCCLETVIISKLDDGQFLLSVMNIGDGKIILVGWDSYELVSSFHNLANTVELERIKEMDGPISVIDGKQYLNGITQITQVIGGYGNKNIKNFQDPNPTVDHIEINVEKHIGLIVINSNVANVLSAHDVVNIFRNEIADPRLDESIYSDENIDLSDPILSSADCSHIPTEKRVINETKECSRVIARKIVNATILNTTYDTDFATIVFRFLK